MRQSRCAQIETQLALGGVGVGAIGGESTETTIFLGVALVATSVGIFARNRASICLLGTANAVVGGRGVRRYEQRFAGPYSRTHDVISTLGASVSEADRPAGFSIHRCLPARATASPISACRKGGVATLTTCSVVPPAPSLTSIVKLSLPW